VLSESAKEKARYEFHSGLFIYVGAGEMNRTPDLLITNEGKVVFWGVDWCSALFVKSHMNQQSSLVCKTI
jgi:hypothetical protein